MRCVGARSRGLVKFRLLFKFLYTTDVSKITVIYFKRFCFISFSLSSPLGKIYAGSSIVQYLTFDFPIASSAKGVFRRAGFLQLWFCPQYAGLVMQWVTGCSCNIWDFQVRVEIQCLCIAWLISISRSSEFPRFNFKTHFLLYLGTLLRNIICCSYWWFFIEISLLLLLL